MLNKTKNSEGKKKLCNNYHVQGWCYPSSYNSETHHFLDKTKFTKMKNAMNFANIVFQQIDVGYDCACGILMDDQLQCWGGYPNGDPMPDPPIHRFQQVSMGYAHGCGITIYGAMRCWGDDTYGQSSPP